ncbi:hypothetical protein BAY59_07535 [Prauserella coralliicola]|nr:hypothetical protein BAY59_07535 [Prauserella coralliicola]
MLREFGVTCPDGEDCLACEQCLRCKHEVAVCRDCWRCPDHADTVSVERECVQYRWDRVTREWRTYHEPNVFDHATGRWSR